MLLNRSTKILVFDRRCMVDSASLRLLQQKGYTNLLAAERSEPDLTKQLSDDYEVRPHLAFGRKLDQQLPELD